MGFASLPENSAQSVRNEKKLKPLSQFALIREERSATKKEERVTPPLLFYFQRLAFF